MYYLYFSWFGSELLFDIVRYSLLASGKKCAATYNHGIAIYKQAAC